MLADGMVETHDGRITPAQLSAMAAAGRAILQAYQQADIEFRLTDVERQIESGKQAW